MWTTIHWSLNIFLKLYSRPALKMLLHFQSEFLPLLSLYMATSRLIVKHFEEIFFELDPISTHHLPGVPFQELFFLVEDLEPITPWNHDKVFHVQAVYSSYGSRKTCLNIKTNTTKSLVFLCNFGFRTK